MLEINIEPTEIYNEITNEFEYVKGYKLQLEHSLISISKWEAKHKKAFLSKKEKTVEETLDYVRFMTINKNVDDLVYYSLNNTHVTQIQNYIDDKMTATVLTRSDLNKKSKTGMSKKNEIITSELIYYWMIALQIPTEYERWHLNRLLTLIDVCNAKNETPTKHSPKKIMSRNASLNAARRKASGSAG